MRYLIWQETIGSGHKEAWSTNTRILRGGYFGKTGATYPASDRGSGNPNDGTDSSEGGTRATLYIL